MEVLEDDVASLHSRILECNIGKYKTFPEAGGRNRIMFINIVFFGMFGSGNPL